MWTVKRNDLNAILDIIAMVPEKLGLPSSEYIWIRGNKNKIRMSVASYISAEVTLEGNGKWPIKEPFFLDRRAFIPWVAAARESKDKHLFEFHERDGQLILKHGTREVSFVNQKKIHGYGNLSRIKSKATNSIEVTDELCEMLSLGRSCAVADTIQPHLNCVYTTGKGNMVTFYAASDYVFYIGKGDKVIGTVKDTIPFPLFLIDLLNVGHLKKITYADKHILLVFKQGYVWESVSEEAVTKFPLRRIKRSSKRAKALTTAFTSSSRRFSRKIITLGYYMQSERRRDWIVIVKGKRGDSKIHLRSILPGIKFNEFLEVNDKVKKSFRVEWPLGALVKIFDFLSKHTRKKPLTLRVSDNNTHSYIHAGGYWLAIPSKQI